MALILGNFGNSLLLYDFKPLLKKLDAQKAVSKQPLKVPSNEAFVGEWRPGLLYLKKLKEEK